MNKVLNLLLFICLTPNITSATLLDDSSIGIPEVVWGAQVDKNQLEHAGGDQDLAAFRDFQGVINKNSLFSLEDIVSFINHSFDVEALGSTKIGLKIIFVRGSLSLKFRSQLGITDSPAYLSQRFTFKGTYTEVLNKLHNLYSSKKERTAGSPNQSDLIGGAFVKLSLTDPVHALSCNSLFR